MSTKRLLLAMFALALTLPLSACRHRCGDTRTYAPPPAPCCNPPVPPPGY